MKKITQIKVVGEDDKTGAIVKYVEMSDGGFYTRCMAYNQTYERLEKSMLQSNEQKLADIPLKVHTIRYLTEAKKSQLVQIKELTKSRIDGTKLFLSEIEKIKKEYLTNNNLVIFYLQVPDKDWNEYTFEDLETFVTALIKANIPHITIPFHCKKSFVENKIFFDKMKKKVKQFQDLIPQFSPKMKKIDGKQILEKIFSETNSKMTFVTGYTPNANHNYYYSYLWAHYPKERLIIGADVPDIFIDRSQKLPVHLALRRFDFDITTRKVTFNLGQKFNFPVSPERVYIYDDTTGGMFSETEQIDWHGRSATDFIMDNFPAHTGLAFREYVLYHNFVALNRTGKKEADAIMKNEHKKYIIKRPILQAYWETV